MTNTTTIYPAPYYPIYKPYKTVDGWVVLYLADRNTSRNVDGGKVHKHRQNAYAKAKRLNDGLPQTLETILRKEDTAEYEFDGYYVYVSEGEVSGYDLTVCKEAMPPHVSEHWKTLDEVEQSLDGTLGYERGARAWSAVESE